MNTTPDALAGPAITARPRTLSGRIVQGLNKTPIHIALGIVAVIWLAPTIGLLITSFRPREDIQATGWWEVWKTLRFTGDNYLGVINAQGMAGAFVNNIIISVPSTLLPLALCSLAAFAFSWINFRFRDTLFLIVVALMMVPAQVAFIPVLQLMKPFGFTNNFIGNDPGGAFVRGGQFDQHRRQPGGC